MHGQVFVSILPKRGDLIVITPGRMLLDLDDAE